MNFTACIRWLCGLAVVVGLFVATPLYAQQCTHLGGSVACPPGVPAGSNSVFFGPDGSVNFSTPGGGLITVPGSLCCTPFVPVVPGPSVTTPSGPAATPGSGNPFQPSNSTGQIALTAPGPDFSLGNDPLGGGARFTDFSDFINSLTVTDILVDTLSGLVGGPTISSTMEQIWAEDARTAGVPTSGLTFEAPPPPLE